MAEKRSAAQPKELQKLNELQISVKSRILERIQSEFERGSTLAATTQHTKSEGTNYGMHTVSDAMVEDLADVWQRVFNAPTQVRTTGKIVQEPGQSG